MTRRPPGPTLFPYPTLSLSNSRHGPYFHYVVSKGWGTWLDRHNRYASQEAAARLAAPVSWSDIFASDPSVRNKALKPFVSRIPGWPLLRFVQAYLLSGGFLEGRPAFTYCVNLGYYEFLIRTKMRELERQAGR